MELNEKWTLLRLLGVGGTSAVYEAIHRNGRRAAVKILAPLGDETRRLAANESWVANAVPHPGVVAVLDDDVDDDGNVYLVMELLEGETLEAKRMRAGGALPLEDALPIFEQVLKVLGVAHAAGIVHRDVKPENVFVTHGGTVKVLDFGLASTAIEAADGHWFGTPGYIAPEQARGAYREIDGRADLWSAAAAFFTVLTGLLVHDETTTEGLVAAAARYEVDLRSIDEVVSAPVEAVFRRALAFDKRDRWDDAETMMNALRVAAESGAALGGRRPRTKKVPFIKGCRSATRFFQFAGAPKANAAEAKERRMTCTLCPVCPGQLVTRPLDPKARLGCARAARSG